MKRPVLLIGRHDARSESVVRDAARASGRGLVHITTEQREFGSLPERLAEFEVAILDLSPGARAADLLSALTRMEFAPPVVALTEEGNAQPIARQSGAAACVRKPFTAESISSILEQVCAEEAAKHAWTSDPWGHPHRRFVCPSEKEEESDDA